MDGEHRDSPKQPVAHLAPAFGGASRALESRDVRRVDITRMLLTGEIYPGNIRRQKT
jgi:hypothetical protein